VKEIDETPVPESESVIVDLLVLETWIALWADNLRLIERLETLEVEVADLHHRRRVSRQQAVDQDPEWH
jgi:hypothetical protein